MRKFTLSMLLLGAAFSMNAQQEYVIFEDDFSWLLPWANALNASGQACGDPIGKNNVSDAVSVSRALNNIKIDVDGAEVSADQKVVDMGYELLIKTNLEETVGKEKSAGNAVYLQRELNAEDIATGVYFKFGLTGYSAGIKTPELANIGNAEISEFTVSFDWTPQRRSNGTYDTTHLSICVNDITTVGSGRENVPDLSLENNSDLKWKHEDIKFTYNLRSTDKITIRPGANQWPGGKTAAYRFYLKNLRITTTTPISTGIAGIEADENAPVEYYNLQGIRVAEPENGLYIVRQGNKVSKKFIRK